MSVIACSPLAFATTALEDINMRLVNYYVQEYKAGNTLLPANVVAVAKAAIALQEAYARKDYQVSASIDVDEDDRELDKKAYERANNSFNGGHPRKGVMWGVARNQLPQSTNPGEYVTIHYKSLNELATAAGLVIAEYTYPLGKGVVIKLMETNNGFNIHSDYGWRYAALWIPADRSAMAGFLL